MPSTWIIHASFSQPVIDFWGFAPRPQTWVEFVVFILCYLYSLVKMDFGVLLYLV